MGKSGIGGSTRLSFKGRARAISISKIFINKQSQLWHLCFAVQILFFGEIFYAG